MYIEGDEPTDDAVIAELRRRLTRDGRREPVFTGGPGLTNRLRQLLARESGRALAQAMLDHPEPHVLVQEGQREAQTEAAETELDVLDALRAMGPCADRAAEGHGGAPAVLGDVS